MSSLPLILRMPNGPEHSIWHACRCRNLAECQLNFDWLKKGLRSLLKRLGALSLQQ